MSWKNYDDQLDTSDHEGRVYGGLPFAKKNRPVTVYEADTDDSEEDEEPDYRMPR
jgi:hypothetical protein